MSSYLKNPPDTFNPNKKRMNRPKTISRYFPSTFSLGHAGQQRVSVSWLKVQYVDSYAVAETRKLCKSGGARLQERSQTGKGYFCKLFTFPTPLHPLPPHTHREVTCCGSFRRTRLSYARSAEWPHNPASLCPSYVAWWAGTATPLSGFSWLTVNSKQ